ncbi:uncharacterized protein LOC130720806 isoform X2 [Lotus japonicus]|uniref:uncharacterized protein LOC130720806 isoform X2 n=1 Tax=Lotus japonicus TaxID=34305 RepID=UPI00258D4456|nr:uncharacterized protein LOC130720806 isoform X2 [Lotus japonicus]
MILMLKLQKDMAIGGRRRFSFSALLDHHLLLPTLLITILFQRAVADHESNILNYTRHRQVSGMRLERISRYLEKINKAPVLTIESPDGDLIDCVHKRKQLAFDHPLLKNHKIQKAPTEMPRGMNVTRDENRNMEGEGGKENRPKEAVWQMWHRNGTWCPKGTVPIRRSTVDDVLRAKSLYEFGKKPPGMLPLSRRTANVSPNDIFSNNDHEHAVAYTGLGSDSPQEIYGAKASINVWEPSIQVMNEFSLSQIWLLSGFFDGSDLNSIEAGWQVSPQIYGDSRPRLFTYWTSDSYGKTGCYNLLCSGFVQIDSRIAIGTAISPLSSYAGNQYEVTILIWKDPNVGNWWLSYGDNILVGYWPAELFTHLADHATGVEWGGEVVNTRANDEHTSTQMGSGHFAEDGYGKASYFRNIEIVDVTNTLRSVQNITTIAETSNCYNIQTSYSKEWGTYFYYGGPGKNPQCP